MYRRADIAGVAAAVAPMSDADAGKRIFDASKALKAADIANVERSTSWPPRCERSSTSRRSRERCRRALTLVVDEPYLRFCRPCNATHLYEQTFQAGRASAPASSCSPGRHHRFSSPLGASSPRVESARGSTSSAAICASSALPRPSTSPHLSTPRSRTSRRTGRTTPSRSRSKAIDAGCWSPTLPLCMRLGRVTALLGPFDLYLQAKDRDLLIPDAGRAKALWPVSADRGRSWSMARSSARGALASQARSSRSTGAVVGTRHQEASRQGARWRRASSRDFAGSSSPRRLSPLMRGG